MKINSTMKFLTTLLTLCFAANVQAQLMLSDKPLFINQSVPPAFTLTFDDSGSMTYAWMPGDSYEWYETIVYALASPDYNKLYYNPDIKYEVPVDWNNQPYRMPDYSFAAIDGFTEVDWIANEGGGNYPDVEGLAIDLNTNYYLVSIVYIDKLNNVFIYFENAGTGFEGELFDEPVPRNGYYYRWIGGENVSREEMSVAGIENWELHEIATAEEKQNFAIWFSYHNTRMKTLIIATLDAFRKLPVDLFKIDWQNLDSTNLRFDGKPTNMNMFSGEHRENMFKWFTNMSIDLATDTNTPIRRAITNVGEYFSRSGAESPYITSLENQEGGVSSQELSCQQNFSLIVTDGYWNDNNLQEYDDGDYDAEIFQLSNMPDGDTSSTTLRYNPATLPMSMYKYKYSTLADNAFKTWATDLRPDLTNNVPTYFLDNTDSSGDIVQLEKGEKWWQNNELFWNPHNDPASWQHVVTYILTMGISGNLDYDVDLPAIRSGEKVWPDFSGVESYLDDTWHAAINSRGKLYAADSPDEVSQAMLDVILDVLKRIGRASSGSVSSSIISESSLSYKTGFDSSNWNGFIYATAINSDGTLGEIQWDAGCKLTGGVCDSVGTNVSAAVSHVNRNIFTYDRNTNTQTAFTHSDMSESQLSSMMDSLYGSILVEDPTISIEDIVKYIRGDQTREIKSGGKFRDRTSLLGDVIHSSALVVRGPGSNYNDEYWSLDSPERAAADEGNGYNDYRETNIERKSIVLVGANDGMLHAFDAGIDTENGGEEYWAYIPSQALHGISELANPQYGHKSFVDATPTVKDAFIFDKWTTVALGGMRYGGKAFYALDLGTDLTSTPKVLWEFNGDDDMGYSYAGGIITRLAVPDSSSSIKSKWVAILPNGYNSTYNKSAMYAIDLETGTLLHKWETNIGNATQPNGMGPPVAADFVVYDSADTSQTYYGADQGTDFVYAGDLAGNIYRFNMNDIFTGNKTPELLFDGGSGGGSYRNPITIAPRLFTPDDGTQDIIVVVGTGKYIVLSDKTITDTNKQYLMGLRDSREPIAGPYNLSDGRLVEQVLSTDDGLRTVTSNNVNKDQGWKIQLPDDNEKVINSLIRNNQSKTLIATSIVPVTGDPCQSGGKSWVMVLDARSGSVPSSGSVFNNASADGILIDDFVLGVNTLTISGGSKQFLNIDTSSDEGTNQITVELDTNTGWRRRSWHRLLF